MLDPAPTTVIDPQLARAVLDEIVPATATRPAYLVLSVHNTDYRLHLLPVGGQILPQLEAKVGKRVLGRVRAQARRVDICRTGGKFIDPVFGTPRRMQGRVVSNSGGVLVVNAGVPVTCKLTAPKQKPEQFEVGVMVTFDVLPGATFELEG